MSNWETCIKSGKCFSYARYNSDGTVQGRCEAHVQVKPDQYNAVTAGTKLMTLDCGGKKISIIGRNESEFQIGNDPKAFTLRDGGNLAILDLSVERGFNVSVSPSAGSDQRVIVKVLRTDGQSVVKEFDSRNGYETWKRGLGNAELASEIVYYFSTADTKYQVRFGFETEEELKRLLQAPEAFIINPKSDEPEFAYGSRELVNYLNGRPSPSEAMEIVYLKNTGGEPVIIKGKAGDLGIFAEQLAYDVSVKTNTTVNNLPPNGDFGIKITGGSGFRNDKNYLKDNLDDVPWVDDAVKKDFLAAQTDKRAEYSQIGIELEGHYIWNVGDWFRAAFGASDNVDYIKGPVETANSSLASNTIATDIGVRLEYPEIFYLGLYPANFGWFVAGGETTLKDTSVKQETDISAVVWQPEAELSFYLGKGRKYAVSAEYYYRHFMESSIPLRGVHAGGLGFTLFFGGSDEKITSSEIDRVERPQQADVPRQIRTTITEQPLEPEKPLIYEAVRFQKAIDVNLGDINTFFEKNKSELRGEGIAKAQELAIKIKTYFSELGKMGIEVDPGTQELTIRAFADSQGKAEYPEAVGKRGNAKLSEDRAQSFSDEVSDDLGDDKITVKSEGMGEQFPDLYKCDGSCDITDIRSETKYGYRNTDKEKALFANGKTTDLNIDKLYKVKTYKGKDSLTGSNYADASYGQVSLDLEGDKKKERYLEDLTASRRLVAQLKYNLNEIDNIQPIPPTQPLTEYSLTIGGATFANVLLPMGSTKSLPETLNVKENGAFISDVIQPLISLVQAVENEADASELIISISLDSRITGRNTEYIGKYMAFVAGRFTDKPVRVFVSVNDRFGDSIIVAKGSQTANIDPASDDENSLKLRNKWLEMLDSD